MRRYVIVIFWRRFQWTLSGWAETPGALRGLAEQFGTEHPISLQVIANG